jgi:hypothetical protein
MVSPVRQKPGKREKKRRKRRCAGTRKNTRGKWCAGKGCDVDDLTGRDRPPGGKRLDHSAMSECHDSQKLLCVPVLCSVWHGASCFVKSRKRLGVVRRREQSKNRWTHCSAQCICRSCHHTPCSVLLSSSGTLSSKIRISRKGSLSQNPFVPQSVAWIGERRAPVGK